jgi:Host cell surface-exposed lipoprotein
VPPPSGAHHALGSQADLGHGTGPQQGYGPAPGPDGPPRGVRPQPPGKSWPRRHKVLTALGSIAGAVVLIAVLASLNSKASPSATGNTTGGTHHTAAAAPASLPSSAPPSSAPPAAPQYTGSQQSAIQDAQSYLSTQPGFSKQGLIAQLEYDKFSHADAAFAVNHITVNWKQQAAADAHNYMSTQGGFSCGGMVSQLEFDKFTPAQAAYGASAVGLGSC